MSSMTRIRLAVVRAGLQARDDVRVAQDRRGECLAPEAHRDVRVLEDFATKEFDRDRPAELGVDARWTVAMPPEPIPSAS